VGGKLKMKGSCRSISKEKNVGLAEWCFLVYSGPAEGVEGYTRSADKGASTSCLRVLLAILHGKQLRKTCLMFCRTRRIHNSCLRWESTTRTPKWCNWIWVWRISKCVTWWDPSKMFGYLSVCDNSANCSLPPSWIRLCSQNG